jgi:hypothetical protein
MPLNPEGHCRAGHKLVLRRNINFLPGLHMLAGPFI